ncbi:hypothetical protein CERSUDRAFT_92345 [Gelatoporia subvermispora B]|uniref:Uncharacterized protein n=1 Tax=Ceriporiopsis subvermispora (strain B) TaxID=914234 RepID=M2QRY9_CERS8|nr:hypothetical protein CERSUDRAFT_92345 [Gelatoporia subvermispora B]
MLPRTASPLRGAPFAAHPAFPTSAARDHTSFPTMPSSSAHTTPVARVTAITKPSKGKKSPKAKIPATDGSTGDDVAEVPAEKVDRAGLYKYSDDEDEDAHGEPDEDESMIEAGQAA